MDDLLREIVELATNPGKGMVALTYLIIGNTLLGIGIALYKKEFDRAKLLDFLGGKRVVIGFPALLFVYLGIAFGLPLLPAYQFVAGMLAGSAALDIVAKLGSLK